MDLPRARHLLRRIADTSPIQSTEGPFACGATVLVSPAKSAAQIPES